MVDPVNDAATARIEQRKDLGTDDAATYAYWMGQEAIAEKEERKWIKTGREIVKRYRDERPQGMEGQSKFNVLWSNVETLKPILYGRTPKPDVERRFRDADPSARLAAILLERCLSYALDDDWFDDVMEAVVEDRLLPGRGTARVLYVPHYGDEIETKDKPSTDNPTFENRDAAQAAVAGEGDEPNKQKEAAEPLREVIWEEVRGDYVFWEDYREGPARQWRQVPWIRYRAYLTRDELIKRFGKKKGKEINLDYTPKGHVESSKEEPPPDLFKKAIIDEYWDKNKREVTWIAPGTPDMVCDKQADPLKLPDFYPSPNPLRSTSTTDKRVPVADYTEYRDQARELDTLTARIDKLTRALKVAGVYAGDEKQVLQQLLDEGVENRLIPVPDVTQWTDKGGMKGIIEWLPIQQIAETLIQLYNARDRVKAILYELTGIGDIMRGMTSPNETYGAQQLKANFSTRRVTPHQKKVAKFARRFLRLMAGVIAEHFSPQTISMMTGYPQLALVPQLPPRPMPSPQVLLAMQQPPAPPVGQNVVPMVPQGTAPEPPQPAPLPPEVAAYQQQVAQWQQLSQKAAKIQQDNAQKQQQFDAAVALIKQDGAHGFKIDIEADSTIAPDEQEEKASRVEFLKEFIPLLSQVMPFAQGNPALCSLAKEMTLFAMRGFRVARSLEETVEKAFDALAQMPPNPAQAGKTTDRADSPQEIAIRSAEIAARLKVDQGKQAVDMAKIASQEDMQREKLANTREIEHAHLALAVADKASEQALRGARLTHIEARDAARLT